MRTIAEQCKQAGSQGDKTVRCVRCKGDIPPYAGRKVTAYTESYAHHPGKCQDQAEREARVRQVAGQASFAWECTHIEPTGDYQPDICSIAGMGRQSADAYLEHFRREHGATQLHPTVAPIKLRKSVPAARRQVPAVPAFKRITWTTTEHYPMADGQPDTVVTNEHRGQFWANGPDAHSVIVIEDRRAAGLPNRLVTLYLDAHGQLSADWSDASVSRREANRRARDHKRYAAA